MKGYIEAKLINVRTVEQSTPTYGLHETTTMTGMKTTSMFLTVVTKVRSSLARIMIQMVGEGMPELLEDVTVSSRELCSLCFYWQSAGSRRSAGSGRCAPPENSNSDDDDDDDHNKGERRGNYELESNPVD